MPEETDIELPGTYEGQGPEDSVQHETTEPPKLARKRTFTFDKSELIEKVLKEYNADLQDRADWSEMRLQRYAKKRGWMEMKTEPWPNASNAHVPLLMTDSLRTQDTLHNAVLGQRPIMSAQAINPADAQKGATIDELIDYQLFVEQKGEEKMGEWIESFVDDGTAVAFIPYIKEDRAVSDVRTYPPLRPDVPGELQVSLILQEAFPGSFLSKTGDDPWGWTVRWVDENRQEQMASVEFYTDEDNHLVMVAERDMRVFDGPCFIPKALEDIVVPARATNLQPPGPSNPGGADHVVMVDYPSWDEIKRLHAQGYYDQVTDAQIEELGTTPAASNPVGTDASDPQEHKHQRDALAGQSYLPSESTAPTVTRLTYFGRYDVDGDGLEEDVIFWVLKESKTLLKVKLLNEQFPALPPRRPFAEARFLPVQGEFYGIGMLELIEHLHDVMKALLDQTLDKNTLVNTPWFLYRAASGVRPEVIRMAPGEGYPVSNPGNDMVFPQIPNADQSTSLNLLSIMQQWAERQAVIGELQFGRVPQGKASALRTVGGMMSVLQQGDARPERILRRFFCGIAEVYQQFHELNQAFLPPKKQYKVASMTQPGKNPYRTLDEPSKIRGRFQFEFKANSLNTNKATQSQILQALGPVFYNGMTFQMGLATPEKFYNWMRQLAISNGQDPHQFIQPPSPDSEKPKYTADQVLYTIYQGMMPNGLPEEGAQAQLQIFQQFQMQPEYFSLDRTCKLMLDKWMQQLQQQAMQQQQQAMMANQFAQMMSGGGGGGMAGSGGNASDGTALGTAGPNQVLDESLPSAKGQVG